MINFCGLLFFHLPLGNQSTKTQDDEKQFYHPVGIFIRAGHQANWQALRIILPTWFDHLEDSFSYKEIQFKKSLDWL